MRFRRARAWLATAVLCAGVTLPLGCGKPDPIPAALLGADFIEPSERNFPEIQPFRLDYPLRSGDWTIKPDEPQTRGQWAWGHPLELRPFRWDFLRLQCEKVLEIKPHYDKSTWDTFWVNTEGRVKAVAFGGLFPITLGEQPELLAGIVSVLAELPDEIRDEDPETAKSIEELTRQLKEIADGIEQPPMTLLDRIPPMPAPPVDPSFRERLSRRIWEWKLRGETEGGEE